jgi:hypothetical protein
MALGDYILPMVFLCLAILLVAQTSITIQNYSSTKKAKDLNYYWSVLVLIVSIIGLFASFYLIYKASTGVGIVGGAENATNGELLDPVNVGALGTSGNASAIDALRAKLATNKGNIMTKLDTELATKLAQLEQARNVLAAYTKGAAAAVTTAV